MRRLLTAPTFVTGGAQVTALRSLARNPLTGDVVSIASIAGNGTLAHVDLQTGAVTPFGPLLSVFISSLAFDSSGNLYGFALCDSTYPNELFQLDPVSGNITGELGSLDSGRVGPCGSGFSMGGSIAIDPATDVLYFTSIDATGALFVDSMSPTLVPTLVYSGSYLILPVLPVAATFAGGKLWVSTLLTQVGPGTGMIAIDPSGTDAEPTNGAAYWALSFPSTAPMPLAPGARREHRLAQASRPAELN